MNFCIPRETTIRRYYANYVKFFTGIVEKLGAGETLEQYVFSPAANGNGTNMLLRFVSGA